MIVFILDAYYTKALEITAASAADALPGCRTISVDERAAERMNGILAASEDDFFLTLHAGDVLSPFFGQCLGDWLSRCSSETGWINFTPIVRRSRAHASRYASPEPRTNPLNSGPLPGEGPVLWRKACVQEGISEGRSGGFPVTDWLPFESYVCLDTMLQSAARWSGITIETDECVPYYRPIPAWRQPQKERELLLPILSRPVNVSTTVSQPAVTIVLCTYNDASYLLWAIRSVFIQTFSGWELIIVDDGSTDDTLQKLAMLPDDSRIHIIRQVNNRGKSRSLNAALAAASGRWLLELDADDWLTPDCLETMLNAAEASGNEIALWYGQYYEWQERANKQLIYSNLHIPRTCVDRHHLLEAATPLAPRFYRTAALRTIGGWSLDAPFGGRLYEDFDIILRLQKRFSVQFVAQGLYHRRNRAHSITHRFADRYVHWKAWMENARKD